MTKTSKRRGTASKRKPEASDKTALSETQLDAASGGDGSSPTLFPGTTTGKHFPTTSL